MEYNIVFSKRKTIAIEIGRDLSVIVRAPIGANRKTIDKFVNSHIEWINRARARMKARENAETDVFSDADGLISKAKEYIPKRLKFYSEVMGLYPTAVKITSAKTRFGSCSGKDSICFSYRLMAYPIEAVDYVIVHELAHIKHKNHSKAFYELIETVMPDYRERNKLLKIIPKGE